RLAGHPILAIGTMKITAHHAEGQRVAPRMNVKERFLLDRIALERGDVTEGDLKLAVLIEPHLADAATPFADQTAMPARDTSNLAIFGVPEFAHDGAAIQNLGQRLAGDACFGRPGGSDTISFGIRYRHYTEGCPSNSCVSKLSFDRDQVFAFPAARRPRRIFL